MENQITMSEYGQLKKQEEKDIYFMRIAKQVGEASKCLSRKIGAVLVKEGSVVSTGYNGPAREVKHCNERTFDFYNELEANYSDKQVHDEVIKECPRRAFGYKSGKGLHLCAASHAERNAILQAARNGVSTDWTVMYCYCPMPCSECMREMINAGVCTIVCLAGEDYDKFSSVMAEEADIYIRKIDRSLVDVINQ